jgi:hypothetical protein
MDSPIISEILVAAAVVCLYGPGLVRSARARLHR